MSGGVDDQLFVDHPEECGAKVDPSSINTHVYGRGPIDGV